MPSQQVIEKLDQLKKELENIKTAAQLIEDATKASTSAGEILNAFPEFLKDQSQNHEYYLQDIQKQHKLILSGLEEQLQNLLQTELPNLINEIRTDQQQNFKNLLNDFDSKYAESVKTLSKITGDDMPKVLQDFTSQTNSISTEILPSVVKSIETNHQTFINALSAKDQETRQLIISDFEEKIRTIDESFQSTLRFLESKTDQLSEIITQIESITQAIKGYLDEIKQIDLPKRLDKIDATTAGLMSGVQAIQSRIDSTERNLTDQNKDLKEIVKAYEQNQSKTFESYKLQMNHMFENQQNRHIRQSIITWILLGASLAMMGYMLI